MIKMFGGEISKGEVYLTIKNFDMHTKNGQT